MTAHRAMMGRVIGPGAYVHFPAGEAMQHHAGGDDGCLFIILFHGPFDVRVIDGGPRDDG